MSTKAERLRAELALAEAEEAFLVTKANKDKDPGAYEVAKHELRAMRQDFRENHRVAPSGAGAAAPSPAPIDVSLIVGED